MTDGKPTEWHRTIFSRGDLAYTHLHAAAGAGHIALALHLSADHDSEPSNCVFGSWCRDVEAHAAAHMVILRPL